MCSLRFFTVGLMSLEVFSYCAVLLFVSNTFQTSVHSQQFAEIKSRQRFLHSVMISSHSYLVHFVFVFRKNIQPEWANMFLTHVAEWIEVVIGQFELLERHQLSHPVSAGGRRVRMDVQSSRHRWFCFTCNRPEGKIQNTHLSFVSETNTFMWVIFLFSNVCSNVI